MQVRQLVGRYAGDIVFMDYADAMACREAGTVELLDVMPAPADAAAPKPQRTLAVARKQPARA